MFTVIEFRLLKIPIITCKIKECVSYMDMSTLKYYATACELNSITKAANKLYISRQAISKSIKNLETMLDTQLVNARHDGIELTEEGQCLYENVKKLIDGWNATLEEIYSIKRSKKITIHVGYGQMSYNLWNTDHIEQYIVQNPNIEISAKIMLPDQLLSGLRNGQLDVIVTSADSDDKCYNISTIKSLRLYALMCINDTLALQHNIGPKDLSERNVYFIPNNQTFLNCFAELMHHEGIDVNCQCCIDSNLPTILNTIKQNQGIYFTSGIFRQFFSFSDEFIMKPFVYDGAYNIPNKHLRAITHKDSLHNLEIKHYVDYLRASVN